MAQTSAPPQARRGLRLAWLAAILILFAAMPAAAEPLEQRINALAPHLTVTQPEGDGPFPVLFMLHGCGGPRPFLDEMTEVAVAAGAVVVNINSYGHRRIGQVRAYATVCTGAQLHGRERAGDLYAAMAWARRQAWADATRFAAIGWSHGGWTILDALSLRSGAEMARATGLEGLADEPLEGLAATMVVYPYTGVGSLVGRRPWRITPRSIAIVAENDYIVGDARRALEHQRGRGAPLEIDIFEGATHAFEDAQARDLRVRFHPAHTAREHEMLRAMIAGL
ncbi:MAG TPA: prolyl oligopeptidase family serine peptidase [Terricaulis sp.]|nr:prolyl oligopeptidase family serine peptidase [Terricaulis sp.]